MSTNDPFSVPDSITLRLKDPRDRRNYERIMKHKGNIGGARMIRLALKITADELDRAQPALPGINR